MWDPEGAFVQAAWTKICGPPTVVVWNLSYHAFMNLLDTKTMCSNTLSSEHTLLECVCRNGWPTSIYEVRHQYWRWTPGSCSIFQFLPKVVSWVEVRAGLITQNSSNSSGKCSIVCLLCNLPNFTTVARRGWFFRKLCHEPRCCWRAVGVC